MQREELIQQVKEIYADYLHSERQNHFHRTTEGITTEAYYGTLQNAVISEISKGTFDTCRSGQEIVNKVTVDKSLLSEWNGRMS